MSQVPERSDGDDPQVRNLAAVATDLLERAAAAPAGRAALTLAAGAGAPLKQTMLALQSGEQLAEHDASGAATLQVVRGRVRLVTGRCGSDSSGELTRSRKVL
jgi:quercetin dioxygenase-like cupin family protein